MWGGGGVRGRGQERMWKTWAVGQVKKVWSEGMDGDVGFVFKFLPVTSSCRTMQTDETSRGGEHCCSAEVGPFLIPPSPPHSFTPSPFITQG